MLTGSLVVCLIWSCFFWVRCDSLGLAEVDKVRFSPDLRVLGMNAISVGPQGGCVTREQDGVIIINSVKVLEINSYCPRERGYNTGTQLVT